jgi:hypothetical protein
MRPSPLLEFRRFLILKSQHFPDCEELKVIRQAVVAVATQDIAERCRAFDAALKTRINDEFLSEDIYPPADKFKQEHVAKAQQFT